MVIFPPTLPLGSTVQPIKTSTTHSVAPSSATHRRNAPTTDRRQRLERRRTGAKKLLVDRRGGLSRRRASIDLSV